MGAFGPHGGGRHRSTAPRVGRRGGGRGTVPGRRKPADSGGMARGLHPRRAGRQGFPSGQRGATTIGAAIAISILVTSLAILTGILHEIYIEDRMERGARAGARAVSLVATAPASEEALKDLVCEAVGRELGPDEGEDCACWIIEIEAFATPRALSAGNVRGPGAAPGGEHADMVLVRLRRPHRNWLSDPGDTDRCPAVDPDEPSAIVAAAIARNERAVVASR